MGKSVFFIGHREAPSELLPILTDAIETHISKYGAADFIVGSYGGFDRRRRRRDRGKKGPSPYHAVVAAPVSPGGATCKNTEGL